ncbi:MAG: acyltransferase family protein [Methyloprofundus sp.]|nr:acyltransferase family protein [Methyloprofundus sp.]
MKLHSNIKYRSDIDGLRAIAVLSVIFFHIDASWIPGGFLGVDIFFVISGYLITLILIKEVAETHKIDIVNFYKRRIKRIIPALLFVLTLTLVTGILWFAPDDLLALSKSMIWSVFSAANIYFFSSIDTGYFAQSSNDLPLLHLWSLGVEEQFYILWPFAILLLLKFINSLKKRIFLSSVLFVISLILAQTIIVKNHSFAYYMLPTRAWELLAGSIAAQLVYSGFRTRIFVCELMAFIGLLSIVLSFIFVTETAPVPGIAAIPVIVGAVLLVLSGTTYLTLIGRILSLKVLVAIGLISYSAYLWHWPALAFIHYALIEIDWLVAVAIVLFTFTMATISYFLVETPLRKKLVSTKNVFLWYFIMPTIVIVASTITIQSIKHKSEFIFPWTRISEANSNILSTSSYKYSCDSHKSEIFTEDRCVYPSNIKKPNAFLIGDSNAAHYLGMLRVFTEYYSFSIRNATKSACPLIFDGEFDWISTSRRKGCSLYRHAIFKEAIKYDTVIVGVSWNYYYSKTEFKKRFEKTIDQLSKNVNHIILLGKVPVFPGYNKECEVRAIRLGSLHCSTRFNNSLQEHMSNHWLRTIAKKYSNIEYFDIRSQLCLEGKECSPYLNDKPVYYNGGHLSMMGSEQIGKKMIQTKDAMLHVFDHLHDQKQIYHTHVLIKNENDIVKFIVKPTSDDVNIAFYLYKNDNRIDTQWYSKKFSYILDKNKYGKGIFKVRYFIVDALNSNPGKATKIEANFSQAIYIDDNKI